MKNFIFVVVAVVLFDANSAQAQSWSARASSSLGKAANAGSRAVQGSLPSQVQAGPSRGSDFGIVTGPSNSRPATPPKQIYRPTGQTLLKSGEQVYQSKTGQKGFVSPTGRGQFPNQITASANTNNGMFRAQGAAPQSTPSQKSYFNYAPANNSNASTSQTSQPSIMQGMTPVQAKAILNGPGRVKPAYSARGKIGAR